MIVRQIFVWKPKICDQSSQLAVAERDQGLLRITKPGGGLDHRIEHGLQIEGRAADDLQHVAGRGLVFQRFLKVGRAGLQRAIRLGAGDRDHRLLGEGLQQFDLTVGEATLLAAAMAIAPMTASPRSIGVVTHRLAVMPPQRWAQSGSDSMSSMRMIRRSRIRPKVRPAVGTIGNCRNVCRSAHAGSSLTPVAARQMNHRSVESYTVAVIRVARFARRARRSDRTPAEDRRARPTSPSARRWWRPDARSARRIRYCAEPAPRRAHSCGVSSCRSSAMAR